MPVPELSELKAALRRRVLAELAKMSPAARSHASAQARASLEKQPRWQGASAVLFYAPHQNELDIWPLVERALVCGKTVVLPRFDSAANRYVGCQIREPGREVAPGRFGIREPVSSCPALPLNGLDLALVPGVAFDWQGRRLGRGRGFYDQILSAVRGTTCGVAFDEQIVGEVPVGPQDVSLNCLLTPTRWVEW